MAGAEADLVQPPVRNDQSAPEFAQDEFVVVFLSPLARTFQE
jgi:hypothetical protein